MTVGSLVLGVINGLTYGLLALGIVLVYKSNRFLNLAYAQLGAVPALLLAKLVLQWGWSWWAAFTLCIVIGAGIGWLVDRGFVSRLRARKTPAVSLLLLTVGISELLLALTYVPAFGPGGTRLYRAGYPVPLRSHLTVGSVVLGGQDILTMLLAPILVLGLACFLRYSSLGKQIRAAASNPDAARLAGVSVRRVSSVTWGLAGALSAITAILQAPSQGTFNAAALGPSLLLLALGGAAFGAFASMPWAFVGGLAIGVVQQVTLGVTKNAGTTHMVVLLLILGVVIARGRAIGRVFATGGAIVEERAPIKIPAVLVDLWLVTRRRLLVGAVALFVAVLLPMLPVFRHESTRFELSLIVVYAIVAVSLCVLVGWAGQVSLGHFALVGVGAFVTARLAQHGVSLLVILVIAGLAGAALMVTVGLPALRVPGLSLAVTSLGLAVVAPDWLFRQSWLGSAQPFGVRVRVLPVAAGLARPASHADVYYIGLAVLVVVLVALAALRRSAPGRLLVAVRDNEDAAATFGVTPATVKLTALAVSGFIAAMAGVVWAESWGSVAATQFTPDLSMAVLAAPVIGGVTSLGGSVAAAALIYAGTFFASPALSGLFGEFGHQVGFQLALGGMGIVLTLMFYPSGLAGVAQRRWEIFLDHLADAGRRGLGASAGADAVAIPLVVDGASVAFGGIHALSGASIRVDKGEIVGLIGPNGAGKSTLMHAISGTLRADSASIRVFGEEVSGLAPEYRAGLGVARSFQDARLFPGLTVTQAIQVALSNRHRVGVLAAAVKAPWVRAAEHASLEEARAMIDRLGLAPWADSLVSELSTGTRRICDLAAQAAARPRLMLLDEPTAGIAQREAEAFGPLLRRIRDELDCAILIIEHDMPLLMGLCDRVYAMDAGRVIAEGTPAEVRSDPAVIGSYLGTEPVAIARSAPAVTNRSGRRVAAGAPTNGFARRRSDREDMS
ncbi:MAG: ABC transporter permease subunit [Acidimicrobiales bacterium]